MSTVQKHTGALLAALIFVAATVGCGKPGPTTHPIAGRIEHPGGNPRLLAGSILEAKLDANPQVRAFGAIQDDGTFKLETLDGGEIYEGALEGTYKVRVVLADDDEPARLAALRAVNRKFFSFDSSGLSIQVPANDVVKLVVSK